MCIGQNPITIQPAAHKPSATNSMQKAKPLFRSSKLWDLSNMKVSNLDFVKPQRKEEI